MEFPVLWAAGVHGLHPLWASNSLGLLQVLESGHEKEVETQNCKATQFYFDFRGY